MSASSAAEQMGSPSVIDMTPPDKLYVAATVDESNRAEDPTSGHRPGSIL
jgi:hypothetical protein